MGWQVRPFLSNFSLQNTAKSLAFTSCPKNKKVNALKVWSGMWARLALRSRTAVDRRTSTWTTRFGVLRSHAVPSTQERREMGREEESSAAQLCSEIKFTRHCGRMLRSPAAFPWTSIRWSLMEPTEFGKQRNLLTSPLANRLHALSVSALSPHPADLITTVAKWKRDSQRSLVKKA